MEMFEHRPWGAWYVLDSGDGYKVKRIDVKPNSRLSLQMHEHRAEYWVVVAGSPTCQVGSEIVQAVPGDVITIAIGQAHRISNNTDEPVVIVETQRGSYTGEDDIVRLEDDYGRAGDHDLR